MTDHTETARHLLDRHGLPEDVIDGALTLHIQEVTALVRAEADKPRQLIESRMARNVRRIRYRQVADLIEAAALGVPLAAAPAVSPPAVDRAALRDRIAEALVGWAYRGKAPKDGGILETVRANAYSRADAVLAVLPAPDQQAAELATARATNQRLNLRAQSLESELAAYRRAVGQWEISERGTYIPHASLRAIGLASGRDILGSVRHLKHFERVEQAEAAIGRVRCLHDNLDAETALTSPDDEITRGAAARRIAAALDGYTPPAAAPAVSSVGQAAHTTRSAEWRAAADHLDGLHLSGVEGGIRTALTDELRRMADETQPAEARCGCPHPEGEHSVYGCADGCGCEWMPKRPPMDPVHILGIKADGETQQPTPCGPVPDQCDAEAGELCAAHEREEAHAEGEHCFCGPECTDGIEETGVALAQYIADQPMSSIQAAIRILGWPPLRFELVDETDQPAVVPAGAGEEPADETLVHVGWWCWRGDNHGHLATMACRSDNVPIHVPAEWETEMRAVIQQLEDGDEEEQPDAPIEPEALPLLFWDEPAGVDHEDGRITAWLSRAVSLAQSVPAGRLILQVDAAGRLRRALTTALNDAYEAQQPNPTTDPQSVHHAPGIVIRCADCRAKGHTVCMDDAVSQPKEAAPAVPQCDGCGHLVHRARKCPAVRYGERCECDEPVATDGEA